MSNNMKSEGMDSSSSKLSAVATTTSSSTTMAGTKRPASLASSSDNKIQSQSQQQLSEKKLRRLEKNRLSARECRRRKKEATELLQRQINVLEGENLRLRLQLQIGEEAEDSLKKEQDKLTETIDTLLKSGASESEIYTTIEEFKEKFADYGRDRRSAIEFHLRNVERLLLPTKTTSVAMRALHGGSVSAMSSSSSSTSSGPTVSTAATQAAPVISPTTSSDSSAASASAAAAAAADSSVLAVDTPNPALQPKAMFQYLVNYLEVSPEQAAALKDSRWVAQELDQCLGQALTMSDELRTRLTQCGKDLEAEFDTVRSILTPTQAAKFLVWVANNSACMHMLNELWSRVYPQPSSATEAAVEGKSEEGGTGGEETST